MPKSYTEMDLITFQGTFSTDEACRERLFICRGLMASDARGVAAKRRTTLKIVIFFSVLKQASSVPHRRHNHAPDQNASGQMVLGNFPRQHGHRSDLHDKQLVYPNQGAPRHDVLKWVNVLVSNAKAFILGTYHGVQKKHLQRYLDEFCYRFNRRFWPGQAFDRLLLACSRSGPMTYAELRG